MFIKFSLNVRFYRPFFETTVRSQVAIEDFHKNIFFLLLWKTQWCFEAFSMGYLKTARKKILLLVITFFYIDARMKKIHQILF